MQSLLVSIACCILLAGGADGEPIPSYLYQPSYCMDKILRGPPRAYVPQPGDLMLATDGNVFWGMTHDWALAFEPHGSGIVFARPDGIDTVRIDEVEPEVEPVDARFDRRPCGDRGVQHPVAGRKIGVSRCDVS